MEKNTVSVNGDEVVRIYREMISDIQHRLVLTEAALREALKQAKKEE